MLFIHMGLLVKKKTSFKLKITCFPLNFLNIFHSSAISVAKVMSVSNTIAWKNIVNF